METAIFSALAEPHRLRIVELLKNGPLTVNEIAERLQIRQPQASKHLRVLLEAGLVEVEAVANRRNYRLRSEPFQTLYDWLKPYLNVWNERFDNLDIYLQKLQAQEDDQPE
ncbi:MULTISPECIES: ArsR/SmtB family transcription factor [Paenibacillaceae]|uniref:ArsR/SmtB family transcription factor n=1 Tax=Paenibacillaceae TaxID=186822 RepID=UPI000491E78F|nr:MULTISPECIES: metalloregulator ArsR/SmtB family transcription factor [Paenibacillaceae]MBN2981112.1 winged helix-turn-helix transcriptional regulator [Cohnella algarum]